MFVIQDNFLPNSGCSICNFSDIDALNFGEIHASNDKSQLIVHLFCLYFSTNLPQLGLDNSGIAGFLVADIKKLIKDSANVKCFYCHKGSATTQCKHPGCDRVYHQICGFKANARFEFLDRFETFCHDHTAIKNDELLHYPEIVGCFLCREGLGAYDPVQTIPSCCGFWMHQQCMRRYAVSSGYSFMCPMCRNKSYVDCAQRHGIYVPQYEAIWEKEYDYTDIERFYKHCDAEECVCPQGRSFSDKKWPVQLCSSCGSYGLHKPCRPESERERPIICDVCVKITTNWKNAEEEIFSQPLPIPEEDREREEDGGGDDDDDFEMVDLTTEYNAHEENIVLSDENQFDVELIDLTPDDPIYPMTVGPERYFRYGDEPLEQKRARDKARRPVIEAFRKDRIALWFRDFERYKDQQCYDGLFLE